MTDGALHILLCPCWQSKQKKEALSKPQHWDRHPSTAGEQKSGRDCGEIPSLFYFPQFTPIRSCKHTAPPRIPPPMRVNRIEWGRNFSVQQSIASPSVFPSMRTNETKSGKNLSRISPRILPAVGGAAKRKHVRPDECSVCLGCSI